MGLTCRCQDFDPDPDAGDVMWMEAQDYSTLGTKRSRRCTSCNARINPGEIVLEIIREKIPEDDIELKIWGDDGLIPRASHYLCEKCADLFLSLDALGFCVNPYECMEELRKQYVQEYVLGDAQ